MSRTGLLQLQLPFSHLKQKEGRIKGIYQQTYSYSLDCCYDRWPHLGRRAVTGQKGWGWVSDYRVCHVWCTFPRGGWSGQGAMAFFSVSYPMYLHISFQKTFLVHNAIAACLYDTLNIHSLNTNEVEHLCCLIIFPRKLPFIFFVFFLKLFSYSFKSAFLQIKAINSLCHICCPFPIFLLVLKASILETFKVSYIVALPG